MAYAITIIENCSRAVLASSPTRRQDLNAFLAVLHRAIREYGPPEALVTDSGSIFLANRARAIYRALGIRKVEIEKGKPWQSYLETAYNTQRRMADFHFAGAEDWIELLEAHDKWMADYNVQEHYAHLHRREGRRSPSEVLSWVKTPRYQEKDLERAFFSARHTRTLDDLVRDLRKADQLGKLREKLSYYQRSHLLILDEVGYLPLDREDANRFFQLVNRRYTKGSMVVTSNKRVSEWAELFGGSDPVQVAERAGERVNHVHLKDVDTNLARRTARREIGFRDAAISGVFEPLGEGDVDVAEVVRRLEHAGYEGWYVLEQDCVVASRPEGTEGPVKDVRKSLDFLKREFAFI